MFNWRRLFYPAPAPVPNVQAKVYHEGDFDIEGLPVFSIERDARQDVTILGIIADKAEDGVLTWVLPISPAAHNALVRRFRAKLAINQPTKA